MHSWLSDYAAYAQLVFDDVEGADVALFPGLDDRLSAFVVHPEKLQRVAIGDERVKQYGARSRVHIDLSG